MDWQNHYRLNIYPCPQKAAVKVKFTIERVMKAEDQKLVYSLPLELYKLVEHFSLRIRGSTGIDTRCPDWIARRKIL